MASALGPNIVTEGLAMMYDAGNTKSFPGGTLVWRDLINRYQKSNGEDTRLFLNGGAQFDTESGGNLVFNGTDRWANQSTGTIGLGSDGTINVWFKQTTATVNKGLVSIGNTLFYIGGSTSTEINAFDGTSYNGGILIPNDRKTSWNMATFTWSLENTGYNKTEVYLNGIGPVSGTLPNITTSGLFYVGVYSSLSFSSYFNGKITNVSVYDRVLTKQEVESNYDALRRRHNL